MDKLEKYWNDIPVDRTISYQQLTWKWGMSERQVRHTLHELSKYDNGDNYILIRSSQGGFYKTDNIEEIKRYKSECVSRALNTFAPVKKINKVLNANTEQVSMTNNLRLTRERLGMTQAEVCGEMYKLGFDIDEPTLSKLENSRILPTTEMLDGLSKIYSVSPEILLPNYTLIY